MNRIVVLSCLIVSIFSLSGYAVPLSPESIERLKASGQLERVVERVEEARARGVDAPGENILQSMRLMRRPHRDDPVTLRVPVILVDFSDNEADQNAHPPEHYEELLFSLNELDPGSMREWYLENSYGEVDIIGEVVGWVRLPQTYDYYVDGQNGYGDWPRNAQRMTYDAVLAVDDDVDFSQFDNNNDDYVDAMFVVHAGPGAEEHDGDEDMIWSHAGGLGDHSIQLDGVWIHRYSTEPEDGRIGIFGHELGHALFGLPDLYDRDYSSEGIGRWSMMSSGNWCGNGRSPAHFDAWCKIRLGFIEPVVLDGNLFDVQIPPIEEESEDACYILWTGGEADNEYFLIENRQQIGFDEHLPGSGLLIYHVDEDVEGWNDNEWYPGHEDEGHYHVALEQADGNWDLEQYENRGDDSDPYPGSEDNHTFDDESTPNSRDYAGDETEVAVLDIELDGGTIICNLLIHGAPDISVDPEELEFGDVTIGEFANRLITVSNIGNAPLAVQRILMEGQHPDQFEIPGDIEPFSLEPNQSRILMLRFRPDEAGRKFATLAIWSDDPDQERFVVFLRGCGLEPVPDIYVDTYEVDFGDVTITEFEDRYLTVGNNGDAPLAVGEMSLIMNYHDQFEIVSGGGPFDLDPDQSRRVRLRFTPTDAGMHNALLRIPSNDPNEAQLNIRLIAHALEPVPDITVTPDPLDFGDVVIGGDRCLNLNVRNDGVRFSVLRVSSTTLESDDFTIVTGGGEFELAMGQGRDILIRFNSRAPAEQKNAVLVIESNDPDEDVYEAQLQGNACEAEAPDISVEPEVIDCGSCPVGQHNERGVTVRNNGNIQLRVNQTNIIGEHAGQFRIIQGGDDFNLNPGEDHMVRVRFSPTSRGIKDRAFLRLLSNDPDENVLDVPMRGVGLAPDITVDPEVIDFGNCLVGHTQNLDVTVSNIGNHQLRVSQTDIIGEHAGQFRIVQGGDPFNLDPARNHVVTVQFRPTSRGVKDQAFLRFDCNDPDENPLDVPMRGVGTAPDIKISADEHYFGRVEVDDRLSWVLTVFNRGNVNLHVESTTFEGPNADQFRVENGGEFAVPPDGDRSLTITFSPQSVGYKEARLHIVSDSPDEEDVFCDVSGRGTVYGSLAFDPEELYFGRVLVDGSADLTLTIINDSDINVTIRNILPEIGCFTTDYEDEFALNPGEEYELTVTFAPEEAGIFEANLYVESEDIRGSVATIPMTGMGAEERFITYYLYFGTYIPDFGPGPVMRITIEGERVAEGELFTIPDYDLGDYDLGESFQVYMDGMSGTTVLVEEGALTEDIELHLVLNNLIVRMGDPMELIGIYCPDEDLQDMLWMFSDFQVWSDGPDSTQLNAGEDYWFDVGNMIVTFTLDDDFLAMLDAFDIDYRRLGAAIWLPDAELWDLEGIASVMLEDELFQIALSHLSMIAGGGEGAFGDLTPLMVAFTEGWNMISINVIPPEEMWEQEEGPDIIRMTEQLRIDEENHHILLMKNENGRFYSPAFNYNNIPYWNLTEGYQVKVDEDVEAMWTGAPIPPDADVPLEEGWNFIAYFPTYELDASAPEFYVLSPIIDHVILAKDGDGNFMVPAFEYSNMPPWRETQGYQVKVDEDVVLNYPPERDEVAVLSVEEQAVSGHWTAPTLTCENMSVLVTLSPQPPLLRGNKGGIKAGDRIAAFNADNFLVGVGTVDKDSRCGFAIWGDDPTTEEIDGAAENEPVDFRLWNETSEVELQANWIQGDGCYHTDGLAVVTLEELTTIPSELSLAKPYPNPFNSSVQLRFALDHKMDVRLVVYDISGREVAVLTDDRLAAGWHSVSWNSSEQASGIYFVRLESQEAVRIAKVILMQ